MPRLSTGEGKKEVRHAYIDLMNKAKEQKHSHEEGISSLYSIYKKANDLLPSVTTGEELRLDACVSGEVVSISSRRVVKLCSGDRIIQEEYISLLKENWNAHEQYVKTVFHGAIFPKNISILGEEEEKTKKKRRQIEEKEIQKPKNEKNKEEETSTKTIKKIIEILTEKKKIPLNQLIVHPTDFSKTVENLLYLSFAVQIERVFLLVEDEIYVTLNKTIEKEESHVILTITRDEAEEAIRKYSLKSSLLEL
ncbi:hypothetical protein NEFER03_1777 [Nematocida sp. LUAm3]|nr:hypothetical protein NEFER03_1777 [Nematocida sp. LUAm3]KAI5173916.1 hypothetical protein NEFER02_0383 [Nematocida sp. LUAm2]KAI5177339.1 hypothetical protein NEFER01_0614 [Nematocida sp. LUAm1]